MPYDQTDFSTIQPYPLSERKNKSRIEDVLIDPSRPPNLNSRQQEIIARIAEAIKKAREKNASVIFAYGAHLVRNGLAPVMKKLIEDGWVTHLMTNGAGVIHDLEFALIGKSTEDVRENVANGTFGIWDETGRLFHAALLSGTLKKMGFGESIGRLIEEQIIIFPSREETIKCLNAAIEGQGDVVALAEMLRALNEGHIKPGSDIVEFPHREHSIAAIAFRRKIPLTVHPGIGYDIINTHPVYNGGLVGSAGGTDFKVLCKGMENLGNGVFCSFGSAIMSPQVFEKGMSVANNLLLQKGCKVEGHSILVNDLQEAPWDWRQGEPPSTDPAYYLRFCKSFSRMGGEMEYLCGDNREVLLGIYQQLSQA